MFLQQRSTPRRLDSWWKLGVGLLGVLTAFLLLVDGVSGVEGGGSYRGRTLVLPYFDTTPGMMTFYRLVHAAPGTASRSVDVALTFFSKEGSACRGRTISIRLTRNDYRLLNVDAVGSLTGGSGKGFALVQARGPEAANTLVGDFVVVDLREGTAWGLNGLSIREGETIRYPEDYFVPFLTRKAPLQAGTSARDTRLIIVPPSWQGETTYTFDARVFDHDENLVSVTGREVDCFADLTVSQLSRGATDELGRFPRGQGFLQTMSRGSTRAVAFQVEGLSFPGENVRWAVWPVHDRTTAEIAPDPFAAPIESIEPDSTPVYP